MLGNVVTAAATVGAKVGTVNGTNNIGVVEEVAGVEVVSFGSELPLALLQLHGATTTWGGCCWGCTASCTGICTVWEGYGDDR